MEDILQEKETQLKITDDILNEHMESSMAVGAISKTKHDYAVKNLNKANSELIAKLDGLNKENKKIALVNKILEANFNEGVKDSSILEEEYSKLKENYEAIKISLLKIR